MRKKILVIIPAAILLLISAICIVVAIIVVTNKKHGTAVVKATEVKDEEQFSFTMDDNTYYCYKVKKDKKDNFIIEAGGFIKIKNNSYDIVGFKNGNKLYTKLEGNNEIIPFDGKKSDSLYKYNISQVNFELYVFTIENQSAEEINIGYIRYWK